MVIKNESEWIWRELVRAYWKIFQHSKEYSSSCYRPVHALRIPEG
jgi:Leu/Phe-tRNA-protein transferase